MDIIILKKESLPESATSSDYAIGLTPFSTPEAALTKAEDSCTAGNRLTAPFSGIETRNTVLQLEDGSFRTITFSIAKA